MARIDPLSDEDLIGKEKVIIIKTETDGVSDSIYVNGEVNSELFDLDIKIKVELETDESTDKTEMFVKDENTGEVLGSNPNSDLFGEDVKIKLELKEENTFKESQNSFKVKPGKYDDADLQNLEFIKAYKSETVIKEEIFTGYDLNNKVVVTKTDNTQEELLTRQKFWLENSQIKMHFCEICGKSFASESRLKRHTMIHTGEKPHSCGTCGKSFNQSSDLKKHKRIHTGEKPFSCETCGKLFSRAYTLKEHQRIYTREKILPTCDTCGKLCSRLSDTSIFCDSCRKSFYNKEAIIHILRFP